MSLISEATDVLIVGAGLAGLSAGVTLQRAGFSVKIVEGTGAVGGRVRTDVRDGLRMDVGFQVLNPAYPASRALLNYDALSLRSFSPGIRILDADGERLFGNPLRDLTYAVDLLKTARKDGFKSLTDTTRFGAYAGNASREDAPSMFESDALTALRNLGLSEEFIDCTLRPFLTGVFLEADLTTSRRFLDFVVGYFIKGVPAVPAEGMQAIPQQLANLLHADSLALNTWVHGIDGTSALTNAGRIKARAIILATDQDTTAAWLGGVSRGWRSVTTWYHTTDMARAQLNQGKAQLTIDGVRGRGPVINTVPISHAAGSYTHSGVHLVSTSVLGTDSSEDMHQQVKGHLATLYGCDTSQWQLAGVYPVHKALPMTNAPFLEQNDASIGGNVYVAGDHLGIPSINTAMASGVRAAHNAIADLRKQ
jgi:glycine/D-amino acid oxidase-like deaminating enzyme